MAHTQLTKLFLQFFPDWSEIFRYALVSFFGGKKTPQFAKTVTAGIAFYVIVMPPDSKKAFPNLFLGSEKAHFLMRFSPSIRETRHEVHHTDTYTKLFHP